MNSIETFFSEYEKTASALAAISTFAAVGVSLWLAGRSEKTRLRASVSNRMIVHDSIDQNNRPTLISVYITNTGAMPLRIPYSYFCWEIPFCKVHWEVLPLDSFQTNPMIPKQQYPVKIEPKHSELFFLLDKAAFNSEMKKSFQRIKYFPKLRTYYINAIISTDDGTTCKATISKELKKEIIECLSA